MEFVRRGGGHNLILDDADDAECLGEAMRSDPLLEQGSQRVGNALAKGGDRS